MSYFRQRDEPVSDYRNAIKTAWESLGLEWPEFYSARGRRVPASLERLAEFAISLNELEREGAIAPRTVAQQQPQPPLPADIEEYVQALLAAPLPEPVPLAAPVLEPVPAPAPVPASVPLRLPFPGSYSRRKGESVADYRAAIKAAWEQFQGRWPEFPKVRGRRVPPSLERLRPFADKLNELEREGAIPPRPKPQLQQLPPQQPPQLPLVYVDKIGDFKNPHAFRRRRAAVRAGGVIWLRYKRTAYGEEVFRERYGGGVTAELTAEWLARVYMEILPTLPARVEDRTYLQVGYEEIQFDVGEPQPVATRSRPFPVNSTYESIYPLFFPLQVKGIVIMQSDHEDVVYDADVNPNHVVVQFLPLPPAGAGRAKAAITKLEDGTIIRDYDSSDGTCLVSVANHMGGKEVERPLKWCRSYPGFSRSDGLPIDALDDIEAITKVTLPVVDLETREVLRPATVGLKLGIGAAIGYDAERKHFTHIVTFPPKEHRVNIVDRYKAQSLTLAELNALRTNMMNRWKATWGNKRSEFVNATNYKQELAIINELIKAERAKEAPDERRRLLICYDYETVHARNGKTKPYCISWCCLDMTKEDPLAALPKNMDEFEAEQKQGRAGLVVTHKCTEAFLEWLANSEYVKSFNDVILEAFNGSRFDATFIAEAAHCRKRLLPKSLLIANGGVLKGSISGGLKFHDLKRFLMGSLANNCKAFAVERVKVGGFSHSKPQAAENNGKLREWCREHSKDLRLYSAFDVLALAELTYKAYLSFRKCPGEPDILAHPTIASMAYKTLKSELKMRGCELPTAPQTAEDEAFMRSGMYAGRVQMMRGRRVVKGKLAMYDIASSYPYTMLNDPYPTGTYKHTDCEVVGKMGIYRCHIHSQHDGLDRTDPANNFPNVTVVPLRDPKGELPLDWTHSGAMDATITSVDIAEIRAAGNIVDVFEGIYWDETTFGNFSPVLSGLETIKGEQDRLKREKSSEYNSALREAAKLFMNSLSGKVAQRAKRKVTILSSDYTTTAAALDTLKQSSVNLSIFGESLLITGTKIEPFNAKKASPCFLACFIYAYARRRLRAALLCGAWYCDTDSALFDEAGAARFRAAHPDWITPEGQDKKFGEWEEELGQDGKTDFISYMVQPKNYAIFGKRSETCKEKCERPCCKPKIRSKGVGERDIVIGYDEAMRVIALDEAGKGEFCEKNKTKTIKDPAAAEEVYKAGVEGRPVYALCMQFRRECGLGAESNNESLGGLFSLRQTYTVKQVGGTESDKSEWETVKALYSGSKAAAYTPPPAAPAKPTYNYIPSTYENRTEWNNEPCALSRKRCAGGLECHHCHATPRGEWREAVLQAREDDMIE